jgi:hypothetical protein
MASLLEDPSGNWHVHFRLARRRFKRSLKTRKENEARALCGRIEDNIRLVERGAKTIPPDADVFLFLLSDGSVQKPVQLPTRLSLLALFKAYERSVDGSVEPSTLKTIGIHLSHFLRLLGSQYDVRNLSQEGLQDYISARQKERTNRGTTVSPTTIRKEIATLNAVWSWAPDSDKLNAFPCKKRLRYG